MEYPSSSPVLASNVSYRVSYAYAPRKQRSGAYSDSKSGWKLGSIDNTYPAAIFFLFSLSAARDSAEARILRTHYIADLIKKAHLAALTLSIVTKPFRRELLRSITRLGTFSKRTMLT